MRDLSRFYKEDGTPKYIRCYDNGGKTADRFTVVFTRTGQTGSNRQVKQNSGHLYVSMSAMPYHPQGFCQHGESQHNPIDYPTYSHLGKKIKFDDLPLDCKELVRDNYKSIWSK